MDQSHWLTVALLTLLVLICVWKLEVFPSIPIHGGGTPESIDPMTYFGSLETRPHDLDAIQRLEI